MAALSGQQNPRLAGSSVASPGEASARSEVEWTVRAWSCHAKTTVVRANPDCLTGVEVIAECSGSGQTDIAECERRARLMAAAPDHALVGWALAMGKARFEFWASGAKGELCVAGLRHATALDEFGVPALTPAARTAISAMRGAE